jgi:hypothetical protein
MVDQPKVDALHKYWAEVWTETRSLHLPRRQRPFGSTVKFGAAGKEAFKEKDCPDPVISWELRPRMNGPFL